MTDALRPVAGAIVVQSVVVSEVAAQGVAGRLARVELAHAPGSDGPKRLVAKFPAPPGLTRDLAEQLRLYHREAAFYRLLAPGAGVPVPRLYGEGVDADGQPVLLLEDLAPATAGDLAAGCSLDRAAAVVDQLARLHGRWWGDPALDAQAWLPRPIDSSDAFTGNGQGRDSWDLFRERYGRELPPRIRALGDQLRADRSVLERLSAPPLTLVHGDLRINNVMFAGDQSAEVAGIIDWQTATRGRGPIDVATLFVTSLAPGDRRIAERELLPAYHAALLREGVRDYTFGQCWTEYRLSVLNQYSQIIFLAAMIDVASEVRDDVGALTGARLMAALMDNDFAGLLPHARRGWLAGLRRRARAALHGRRATAA